MRISNSGIHEDDFISAECSHGVSTDLEIRSAGCSLDMLVVLSVLPGASTSLLPLTPMRILSAGGSELQLLLTGDTALSLLDHVTSESSKYSASSSTSAMANYKKQC